MKYTDKNGNEIKAGMKILMDDGSIEEVFATMDQYGNPDLGINASNEDYMRINEIPEEMREYYSLYNFSPRDMEIIPEKEKIITVLVVEPMKKPEVRQINNTLESMQQIVGGEIQEIMPFDDPIVVICNLDGKNNGIIPNRLLKNSEGKPYDVLCGTFFIAGDDMEGFKSITSEQIEKYTKLFDKEMLMPASKKKKSIQKERKKIC